VYVGGPRSAGDLQDSYHILFICNLFLSLFLRIKQEPSATERSMQMKDLMDVLPFRIGNNDSTEFDIIWFTKTLKFVSFL
jgi:hypothetical protein